MSTPTFTPADEAVRRELRERLDANLCVEAGAGTGKTTVLVDRIVELLRAGAPVESMAVITFTEKAAAELAARVRDRLHDAARTADADERERLERALRGLSAAHIETIHAFAASMLRERPVEALLDPAFQVMDALPAQLDFDREFSEWLRGEMASDPPPAPLLEALDLGLRFSLVREAALELHRNREMLPLDPPAPLGWSADELWPVLDDAERVFIAHEHAVVDDTDGAYLEQFKARDLMAQLRALRGSAALHRAITRAPAIKTKPGKQSNWRTVSDCKAVKGALQSVKDAIDKGRDTMRQHATAELVHWMQGFVRGYESHRRQHGVANFDDLLIWARDLVRDDADARAYFREKYERVLVDEFQDTDPVQAELIVIICSKGGSDWRNATLRPGSLFLVGDPKQSIYRFRRADIAMYDAVKGRLFPEPANRIVQNFRSSGPVVDWVNETFGAMFVPSPGRQPEYVPLEAHPSYVAQGGVRVIADTVDVHGSGSADELRRREAEIIAAFVRRSAERADLPVRDGGGTRAATYRDMVVLVPNRIELEIYEDVMARADVPYRHEGGRTFFKRQEVRELAALLRCIDDPGDGVACVASLKSAAFGCSDEELLLHLDAGGRFDHAFPGKATGPVSDALGVLAGFARARYRTPLPDLVRAVIDRCRLVEFAMLQPQGDQLAANLLKVIDQARTFADASGGGLRGFVRWIHENVTRATDETDALISEDTDDVVRIMTVHAAKGLEFPVVIFANMNGERADRTTTVADRASRALHMKLGKKDDNFSTPGFFAAAAGEAQYGDAEEQRQLYVAATRAKDWLIVPLVRPSAPPPPKASSKPSSKPAPGAKCLNDWLLQAGVGGGNVADGSELRLPAAEPPVWRSRVQPVDVREIERVVAERSAWEQANNRLLERASVGLAVLTASGLKPEWQHQLAEEGEIRRARATEFGSAVHAALERAQLDDARIEGAALAAAADAGMPERADEILSVARRALASDAVLRARAAHRLLLEAPFTVSIGGVLAEGRIDVLFEEDGAITVADFKTDDVRAAETAARAQQYRTQALVYAWSAHRGTKMPVREVIFVFARPGVEERFAVDAAFLSEAEALLSDAAAVASA